MLAASYGTSVNGSGVIVTRDTTNASRSVALRVEGGGGHLGHRARFLGRLPSQFRQRVVLLVGEARELAEPPCELDRVLLVLAAEAAEVEDRIDRALELERALAALG